VIKINQGPFSHSREYGSRYSNCYRSKRVEGNEGIMRYGCLIYVLDVGHVICCLVIFTNYVSQCVSFCSMAVFMVKWSSRGGSMF